MYNGTIHWIATTICWARCLSGRVLNAFDSPVGSLEKSIIHCAPERESRCAPRGRTCPQNKRRTGRKTTYPILFLSFPIPILSYPSTILSYSYPTPILFVSYPISILSYSYSYSYSIQYLFYPILSYPILFLSYPIPILSYPILFPFLSYSYPILFLSYLILSYPHSYPIRILFRSYSFSIPILFLSSPIPIPILFLSCSNREVKVEPKLMPKCIPNGREESKGNKIEQKLL